MYILAVREDMSSRIGHGLPEHYHADAGIPEHYSSLIGIITAIIGNILISFALNTQRYAHIRIEREFKHKADPAAKGVRKQLPKKLRNYGTAVAQEEAAEERQRINENATVPAELDGHEEDENEARVNGNGKRKSSDDTLTANTQDGHDEGEKGEGEHRRKSYLKSPWWWLGITLMTIGETGNFLAYAFAPASIVSPLGVVALISNCLIAPLMLKERFRQRDFWGVLIAIGGAVTVVLSAKTSEKKLNPDTLWTDIKRWEFLVYVLITVVFIIVLMFASPKYGHRTIMVDLGLVGLFGGYTALSTKGVASILSTSLYRAFEYPIFYVLIFVLAFSAVMQIRYLNRGLQNFASTQVIPVQFVLFTLSVIIGSAVLYRDFERTDVEHVIKFVAGCILTFGGVYLITSGRKPEDEDEDDDEVHDHDVERIHLLDEEANETQEQPTSKEQDLHVDTSLEPPKTPRSPASPVIPSIAVTPAASADDLNNNPWLSSTDHLARIEENATNRPMTPTKQTIPDASSSQTPFFTPSTTRPARDRLSRVMTSPAQPETPTKRTASPSKPNIEDLPPSALKRNSISRLLPGPILQPLSSSLSGIVADRILRGEGTPSPVRSPLRRHKSNRESTRLRVPESDLEAQMPDAFNSEISIHRTGIPVNTPSNLRRIRTGTSTSGDAGEDNTDSEGFGGSLRRAKGRLRSMSETLGNFMSGRRGSRDDGEAARGGGPPNS